jgi:hypothetical protein
MNSSSLKEIDSRLTRHSHAVEKILIFVLWLCAIIMFLILGCGIFKIGKAIYYMFADPAHEKAVLSHILNGLELIFVSPLIYLLMLSLLKYINAVKPRIEPDLAKKNKYLNNALLEIMTVKTLSVALFISILILHSIELLLENNMTINNLMYHGILLIILIGYYYLLDILAGALKKHLLEG